MRIRGTYFAVADGARHGRDAGSVRAMRTRCRVLLISGSLRAMSTNTALLRTARDVATGAVEAVLYDGLGALPHFNPDDDPEGGPVHPAVADLRAQLAAADALLFCTPEYAGALPGSFKNLLDWTVGGGETYGMPVGWVNASGIASPTGAAGAHGSLRAVLTYTGTDVVEAACVRIPVARGAVGSDGLIEDPSVRDVVAAVLATLAEHVAANASA
jgi:NAD(P)H-dependent FMN reductase